MSVKTILQVLPDFALAGAERMTQHLSMELSSRGWNVIAVSLFNKHTEITEELEAAGIVVEYLGKKSGLDLSMIPKLRSIFKRTVPVAVHSHRYCMQYTVPAALGLNLHEVHTVHNIASKEVPSRIQIIQKHAFRSGKAVPVAINSTVRDSICSLYSLDMESVPLVYNGVPKYKAASVSLPGKSNAFAFLNIGRAMPQKNQLAMIRAFWSFHQSVPDTKLLIIGDGELREEIDEEIASLDARGYIFQLGRLSNARDYCYAADAFVLPSLYEGMPMTLIEAMSAGMPVIASNRGGSIDMVQDGKTGYLCDPDEVSIESAFKRLYADGNRGEIAKAGKKASLSFTSSAMADGYEELYSRWL